MRELRKNAPASGRIRAKLGPIFSAFSARSSPDEGANPARPVDLVLAFLPGNPDRGAAFQAAMPPFVGACLLSGFPSHSTTTPSWHELSAGL